MHLTQQNTRAFLDGGGEMGALIRSTDWSRTPLGSPDDWPQSLKTAISIILRSGYPMFVWWGPELLMFHNDAYLPVLGKKHPEALGKSAKKMWSELWPQIGSMVDSVFNGEQVYAKDLQMFLGRKGFLEETYWTFSYSPIVNDNNEIGGLFCACNEETDKIFTERRLKAVNKISDLGLVCRTAAELYNQASELLTKFDPNDVPFNFIYTLDERSLRAKLVASNIFEGSAISDHSIDLTELVDDEWGLQKAFRTNNHQLLDIIPDGYVSFSLGIVEEPRKAIVLPLGVSGQETLRGFLICGLNPRIEFTEGYFDFLNLVSNEISRAVTGIQTLEAEKKRAEALEQIDKAKTIFFSNVSHEFRTPLALMLGPLEKKLAQSDGKDKADVEMMYRNARRLLKLVNNLLDFSKIEAGKVETIYRPTDISAFTSSIVNSFHSAVESVGLDYRIDIQKISEPVYVDHDQWEKIVLNLLSNAFKYTKKGTITVKLRAINDHLELSVIDTGTGIPENEISKVFDRFHRIENSEARTFEGSGIGLSLVQELVRLHGGTVSVNSKLGKGSEFIVRIPKGKEHLNDKDVQPGQETKKRIDTELYLYGMGAVEETLQGSDKKQQFILVVDDNEDMRIYLKSLLSSGHTVECAVDGQDALEKIRVHRPQLVITDVMMPRLDGFGLLNEIRKDPTLRTLPVIMLSAKAGEEAKTEGMKAGADDYLVKPFKASELLAVIDRHLTLSKVQDEINTKLRNEREQMVKLIKQAPVAMAILRGPDLVFEIANENYLRIIDRSAEEIMNKRLVEVLPELKEQPIIDILNNVYKSGEPYYGNEVEIELQREGRKDVAYFNLVYQPYVESGNIEGIMAIGYEITDHVHTRRHLEKSEMGYREIIRELPAAIYTCDLTGKIDLYNEAAVSLWGKEPAEDDRWIVAAKAFDIDGKEIKSEDSPMARTVRAGQAVNGVELILERHDGVRRYILPHPRPIFNSKGEITGGINMLLDITEQKKVEADLARFAAIVTTSEDAIVSKTLDGIVTSWNRGAEKVFGYTADEMIGQHISKLIPEDRLDEETDILRKLRNGQVIEHFETKRRRGDGRIIDVSLTISPVKDTRGNIIGASKIARDVTNQKLAERDVARLASIVTSSEDAIVSKSLDGIVSTWNIGAEKIFGYTAEEMIGQHITRLIPDDRLDEETRIIEKLKRGEAVEHFETIRRRKDGYLIDISLTISPIRDAKGNVIGASKIARDITKQKNINKLIRDSEERFRMVANTAPVMIWMSDANKQCTFFNKGWFDFTGRTLEQEYGSGWTQGIHRDDFDLTLTTYLTNFDRRTEFKMESRFRRKDGEYRWLAVYARPYYDIDMTFRGYIGACVDVQEQRETKLELEKRVSERTLELLQKNKELLDQKNFVETILDASVDVVAVFDSNLNYVALNRVGSELYKNSTGIVGKNLLTLYPHLEGTQFHKNILKAFAGDTVHDRAYHSQILDRTFENFFIPLKYDGDKPVEVLVIGHDITETIKYSHRIKQTNELLEKKNRELEQSNNELASFSYVASHDLQEPLRKIRMFGKMIVDQESSSLSENGRDYLKRMVNASDRMQNLIEALLEFSRTNTASRNFEKTDLNLLMEEVLKELAERIKETKADIKIDKLPSLHVIPFQFIQMFVNIISNSIKYAKDGVRPEIHITSEIIPAEKLDHPDAVVGMDYCGISVTDNGIGFEPQYSEKVFELFQRLHGRNEYSGSGIGLAICKKIAKNHNGFIRAESTPDVGTTIKVFIPC